VISPGGTFTVDYHAGGDASRMQVVVVFDPDEGVDVGADYVYTFPVGQYEDPFGDLRETRSFGCPGVPAGDYFVYAFLDYYSEGVCESDWPDYEVSWTSGEPNYSIDTSGTPYLITAQYYPPVPNDTVTSSYAAPATAAPLLDCRPDSCYRGGTPAGCRTPASCATARHACIRPIPRAGEGAPHG
jgi:hypothetical protein